MLTLYVGISHVLLQLIKCLSQQLWSNILRIFWDLKHVTACLLVKLDCGSSGFTMIQYELPHSDCLTDFGLTQHVHQKSAQKACEHYVKVHHYKISICVSHQRQIIVLQSQKKDLNPENEYHVYEENRFLLVCYRVFVSVMFHEGAHCHRIIVSVNVETLLIVPFCLTRFSFYLLDNPLLVLRF